MFFHTIIILMSGSTSKGEWKEPWHNGNMHNIEDFPFFFILLLLLFFTYSYIRPSIGKVQAQTWIDQEFPCPILGNAANFDVLITGFYVPIIIGIAD